MAPPIPAPPTVDLVTKLDGADQDPIVDIGISGPITPTSNTLRRTSNVMDTANTGPGTCQGWYTGRIYLDVESAFQFPTVGSAAGGFATIFLRLQTPNTANWDGYACSWIVDTAEFLVERVVNGTFTTLASLATGVTPNAGNWLLARCWGSGASVWIEMWRDSGNGYVKIGEFEDTNAARIVTAGFVGWALAPLSDANAQMDNLMFGDINSAGLYLPESIGRLPAFTLPGVDTIGGMNLQLTGGGNHTEFTDLTTPDTSVIYTDADTVLVDIQVASTESADFSDNGTSIYVDIQTSAAEVHEIPDAAQVYIDIQCISTSETAQFVDAATVLVDIDCSSVDTAQFVDAATVLVDIDCSSVDTIQAIESATVYVDIDCIVTFEEHQTYDVATVYVDIDCSTTFEEHTTFDSATVLVDIQVATTDIAQYVEDNTVYVDIQPSSADTAQYVEAQTVYVDIDCSATDTAQYVETNTVYVDIDCSTTDTIQAVEAQTVYVDIQPITTVEDHTTYDAAEIYVDIQTSATDTAQFVDAASAYVDIDCSSTDTAQDVEANTVYVDIDCSASDILAAIEANEVYVDIQCSATDILDAVDAAEVYVDIQPSGNETQSGAFTYTDSATVPIVIGPTASDIAALVDADTIAVDINCSGTELAEFVDSATVYFDIVPATTDGTEHTDTAIVPVAIVISPVEVFTGVDAQTVLILLSPGGTEIKESGGDAATIYVDIQPATLILTVDFMLDVVGTTTRYLVEAVVARWDMIKEAVARTMAGDATARVEVLTPEAVGRITVLEQRRYQWRS